MKPCYFFVSFLLITACSQKDNIIPPLVTDTIHKLEKQFAPDKRTAIFDIQASLTNGILLLKGETFNKEAKNQLLQELASFTPIDSIEILPNASLEGKHFGVVNIPVANMRSKPGHSSELSNQILCGTVLRLFKYQSGWIYCQTPDDYLGWIDLDALQCMDSSEINTWWSKPKVIVTNDHSYIFERQSSLSPLVSTISLGAILESGDEYKDYYLVTFPDGRTGYLPGAHGADYTLWKTKQTKAPGATAVLNTANMLKGTPYLWGGTSANGVDCSGFTKMVFFQHGLLLPRDASQQVSVGLPIETDTTLTNLLPGDFLFFGRKATETSPEKITHVAIYIGEGKIIHASGYVKVQSLIRGDADFAENRLTSLVRATRPLSSPKENGIPFISDLKYFQ